MPRSAVEGGAETLVVEGLTYPRNFAVGDRGLYFVAIHGAPHETSLDLHEFATARRSRVLTLGQR